MIYYIQFPDDAFHCIVYSVLSLTLALLIYENVVFHKVNETPLTRSKSLSTFIIDLTPYENFY